MRTWSSVPLPFVSVAVSVLTLVVLLLALLALMTFGASLAVMVVVVMVVMMVLFTALPALPTGLAPAVLATHVFVLPQLARVGLPLSAPVLALLSGVAAALLLTGLLVLGVAVSDVLVSVGLVMLSRPLRTGPARSVAATGGVSGPPLAVAHLLVLILSVTATASPTALIVSCHVHPPFRVTIGVSLWVLGRS